MSFHSWLQSLLSASAPRRSPRSHRRPGSLRAATYRPILEVLEDRLTLSFTYLGAYPFEEFSQTPENSVASSYDSVTADFNGDGLLDLFTMTSPEDIYSLGFVYLNRGDGTFELEGSGYAGTGYDPQPYWIGTGDFTVPGFPADGLPDLAILHWPSDVTIYHNNGLWPNSPQLRIGGASVTEGNTGVVEAAFTVTLDNGPDQPVTIQYVTSDADAAAGSDYQAASGILTFAPGETSKTITVIVNGDRIPESDYEFFLVNLSEPMNAVLASSQGWGSIRDDEPRLSIGNSIITEGNTSAQGVNFTIMLDAASTETISVAYATADGAATAGSDYQAASGAVTFAPGETSKTITVLVNGDRLPEPNETFSVRLTDAPNASIANALGLATILDNEPRISINNLSQKEGNGKKTTTFTFTVTLSAAYDQAVTMSYRTVNGTATTGDGDYIAKTGTLTFAPGQTTKTITIEVKGDSKKEANETFYLDLFGNSSNSLFAKNRGIGTILNDD